MSDTETKTSPSGSRVALVRAKLAQAIWTVCLVLALVLIAGALLIALGANADNALVTFVVDIADRVDLGVFDRDNGILKFDEGSRHSREVKNALVNWGLAGIVWMILGRLGAKLIRG